MQQIFGQLCNLSISASWLILAVLAVRFLIRKAPKKYSCMLWLLVGIRLVLPFSIESSLSLVPTVNISYFVQEEVSSEDDVKEPTMPVYTETTLPENIGVQIYRPMETAKQAPAKFSIQTALPYVWLGGVALMLIYFTFSSLYLKLKLSTAVRLKKNIYQSEYVTSPFVYGLFLPKIYVPYHMDEESLKFVLLHENIHIKRRDHWTKAIAFFILSVYWFHPLVWLSYTLLSKDIEMACDEQVVAEMDNENRKSYSMALLACHGKRTWYHACPVGFGEANVKERIIRVKKYRKPSFWVVILCILLCVVVAVCFLTSGKDKSKEADIPSQKMIEEADLPSMANEPVSDRYGATIHFPLSEEAKEMFFTDNTFEIDGHPVVIKEILDADGQYELVFEFYGIEKDGKYSFISPFMSSNGYAIDDESRKHLSITYTLDGEEHTRTQHWNSLQYIKNGIRVGYYLLNSTEEIEAVKQGAEIEMRVEFPMLYKQIWSDEDELLSETEASPVIPPVKWTYSPMLSATWHGFFQFYFDIPQSYTHIEATCDYGILVDRGSGGEMERNPVRFEAGATINWTPDLTDNRYQDMTVDPAIIQLKVYDDKKLLYSDEIEIVHIGTKDGQSFYEASMTGNGGLALQKLEEGMGAMVIPVERVGLVLSADLRHDGTEVDVFVHTIEPEYLYELSIEEKGAVLWSTEVGTPHTAWNTLMYYYGDDGKYYLVQYQPTMFQGRGNYTCRVFSLEDGKQTIHKEYHVEFDAMKPKTPEMEQFAKEVGLLLRSCYVLLSTEQGIAVDKYTRASDLPQLYPVRFDPEEIQKAIDGTLYPMELTSNKASFPTEPIELLYASGAGAWGTYVTINPDGSFMGSYSDADMGSGTSPETPNGTYYVCDFSGSFTDIQQIRDYAWSMKLESLTLEKEPDQTWIEDGTQYISSEAWGIKDGEEFILYAPGTLGDQLTPECRSWWPQEWQWRAGEIEALDGWGLYNVNTGDGFFDDWLD